ncbi:MAG TPA: CsbD family protein [Gemmatimonadota bacterium]|nr:CsbD family protein [Gemmatimonadota bacterium]
MPNKDEIKGKAKQARGAVEQKAGEWTGDRDREAEGQAKRTEGRIQEKYGEVKRETGERVEEAGKKLKR